MTVNTYAAYRAGIVGPYQIMEVAVAGITTGVSGRPISMWKAQAQPGATPTTAAVPVSTTVGALRDPLFQNANTANKQILTQVHMACTSPGYWWLIDRLSHQGGLSGTVVGTQAATNLPTAALTRDTGGADVVGMVEIYTAIGTTGTTGQATYTDNAGNAAQVGEAFEIGGTGFREVGRCLFFPLLAGDKGMRAVSDVQLAASTVSAAGNFGVTLVQPLAAWYCPGLSSMGLVWDGALNMGGQLPQISDDSCLQLICFPHTQNTQPANFQFRFMENP